MPFAAATSDRSGASSASSTDGDSTPPPFRPAGTAAPATTSGPAAPLATSPPAANAMSPSTSVSSSPLFTPSPSAARHTGGLTSAASHPVGSSSGGGAVNISPTRRIHSDDRATTVSGLAAAARATATTPPRGVGWAGASPTSSSASPAAASHNKHERPLYLADTANTTVASGFGGDDVNRVVASPAHASSPRYAAGDTDDAATAAAMQQQQHRALYGTPIAPSPMSTATPTSTPRHQSSTAREGSGRAAAAEPMVVAPVRTGAQHSGSRGAVTVPTAATAASGRGGSGSVGEVAGTMGGGTAAPVSFAALMGGDVNAGPGVGGAAADGGALDAERERQLIELLTKAARDIKATRAAHKRLEEENVKLRQSMLQQQQRNRTPQRSASTGSTGNSNKENSPFYVGPVLSHGQVSELAELRKQVAALTGRTQRLEEDLTASRAKCRELQQRCVEQQRALLAAGAAAAAAGSEQHPASGAGSRSGSVGGGYAANEHVIQQRHAAVIAAAALAAGRHSTSASARNASPAGRGGGHGGASGAAHPTAARALPLPVPAVLPPTAAAVAHAATSTSAPFQRQTSATGGTSVMSHGSHSYVAMSSVGSANDPIVPRSANAVPAPHLRGTNTAAPSARVARSASHNPLGSTAAASTAAVPRAASVSGSRPPPSPRQPARLQPQPQQQPQYRDPTQVLPPPAIAVIASGAVDRDARTSDPAFVAAEAKRAAQARQYNEVMLSRLRRAIAPLPSRKQVGEVVDAMVGELVRSLERHGAQLPLQRVDACVYQCGRRRLHLAVDSGRLTVKCGGGHVDLLEYIERNRLCTRA